MEAIIREIDKEYFNDHFKGIPVLAYDIEFVTSKSVNIIVYNLIAVGETRDKLTRVCFGKNIKHPFIVDLASSSYYTIEII